MEDAGEDPTVFTARSLPSDPRLLATVTNAYLGTRVYHDTLHVSGVYNGAGGDTHRALLPSPLNVQLEAPAETGRELTETFVLDTNTGSFLHTLEGPSFQASQRIYAHRTLPHVMAFTVSITRVAMGSWPITVLLRSAFSPESPDLDLHLGPDFQGARYLYGHTLTPEQPGGPQQEVHMLWTPVPPALTLGESEEDQTWEFLTVVGGSQAEAQLCFTEALQLQDLWMFPTVLLFQPEAARALLEYRIRTLDGALDNARKLGYQGAKFAWESAGSGREVCPEDVYGAQEIHVNGAVVLAFQLYYHATQDVQLFREAGGWDVVRAVAEFWCSRVEWSPEEEEYQLKGVMPPDEYHSGVDNSVYTNVLVQNNLRFAAALARDLGRPVPTEWLAVAEKIKVPFDPRQDFHPEFDGYQPGEEVKQADVVLLGYPVPFHLSPHTRRRNLEIYEAATSPRGPAMTWSMFAVGWMELKDPRRAQDFLERSFANIAEPFKVWTENADGSGAVNFLTGMGGFLQAALCGFTGFRITGAGVTFDPMCPAGVSAVRVRGLCYQGNRLDFSFSEGSVTIEVKAQPGPGAPPLEAELWLTHTRVPLLPGGQPAQTHRSIQSRCPLSLQGTESPSPILLDGYRGHSRLEQRQQVPLQEFPKRTLRTLDPCPTTHGTPVSSPWCCLGHSAPA
ncbi:protein-glucosylgalactosylhydroxylysine glucosidase isoform X3 [Canis lupus familiaris]|uniref:protein-glucosylgalactosylhydroxylysine glucosidase isoform X3 n=1 Tax=Canis lupus dingo TaxID=286419 RepID=UPI000DC6B4B9|nr:protein-glucosylgalactosylhydroxylysine glucosidase isoform X3 [Canis lupus dingo]XP_038310124.1 protein-glucosylgalactosylhydroxylysine glucosidase isoform X3 [Canis lupus familiaris]XP_038418829.1 protein-glucosylgalactosylhydroxylysine glucosidase isoform X3 [Canis lupus familiaris]